jgi:PAS domain S-box-containing protein
MTARKLAEGLATTYEIDIVAKDGRIVSLELSTRLIGEPASPPASQGIGRDITERKRQDNALRKASTATGSWVKEYFHQV